MPADAEHVAFVRHYEQGIVKADAPLDQVNELLIRLRRPSFNYGPATVSKDAAQLQATIIDRGVELTAKRYRIDPLEEDRIEQLRGAYQLLVGSRSQQVLMCDEQLDDTHEVDIGGEFGVIGLTPRMIYTISQSLAEDQSEANHG